MTSKKKFPPIKFYLSAFILFTTLVSQQVKSQNIAVQSGSTCVGQAVYQLQMGGICATTWTITGAPAGSYTAGTQTTNSYNVIWNTAVTGAVVNASYTLQPSCGASTHVTLTVNIAPLPSAPSVPVLLGGATVCQGSTSRFTSSGSQFYNWSVTNAGASTISWSGSTATVTWDPNFYGTATVSVQASNSCGAVSAAASSSVTVTQSKTYTVVLHGPVSQGCFDLSGPVGFQAIVSGGGSNVTLPTLGYMWYVDGTVISGDNPVPGSNGVNLASSIGANVHVGSSVYCTVSTNALCVTSSVTSVPYIVPTPAPTITPTASVLVTSGVNYCEGQTITFTAASAYLGGSSGYNWKQNGVALGSAANSITLQASGTSYGAGKFNPAHDVVTVDITNLTGSCLASTTATGTSASIPIVVTQFITPAIAIKSDDTAKPVCVNDILTCFATVSNGGAMPDIQWRVNGSNVAGANHNPFLTNAINSQQKIDCIVTNNDACVTSHTAPSNVLSVITRPVVSTPGVITGPTTALQQGNSNYLVSDPGNDATGFNWSVSPAGAGTGYPDGTIAWGNENIFTTATVSVTANGCGGPSAAVSLQVTLLPPLAGGSILSGNVTIVPGGNPGRIVTSPAYGGTCTGSYQYQWQQSTSSSAGPYTDIAGSTAKDFLPGVISTITYFRRKVTCDIYTAFTNVITVTTGTVSATNQNYVRERLITQFGVTNLTNAGQLTDPYAVQQKTTYFDGFGNPSQTVAKQASPSTSDMVTTHVYDPFLRESITLLGYTDAGADGNFKGNATSDQYTFNKTQFPSEQYYYSQTDFEASALERPMATYAPGNSWVGSGRNIAAQYLFNTVSDSVRIWSVAMATGSMPVNAGAYLAGQLYKNISADEHGNKTVEYKDLQGRVILKKVQLSLTPSTGISGWLCTYYLYDDIGNLRYVFQPTLSKTIHGAPSTYVVSSTDLTNFAFQYNYDARQRMSTKQVPGASAVYMVYDTNDRLVMTQDGNQRTAMQWTVTKYDILGRPIMAGIYTHTAVIDQPGMQGLISTTLFYETYTGTLANHGYSNTVFPTSGFDPLTVTYYDNYNFKSLFTNTNSFDYLNTELNGTGGYKAQLQSANQNTIGQVTGSKVRMISAASWLKSIHYYDSTYRPIQVIADNTKGHEITTTVYDFVGKPKRTKTSLYTGQPVTWTNVVGATAQANNLSFTGSSGTDWSQGATSTQTLPANTDGWVEVTMPQVSVGIMIGLGDSGPVGTGNIDYGWYVGTGQLNTHENNTNVGQGSVILGDVLRVERINGIIYYKKNGVIIRSSATPSAAALFVYASLRNTGAKIANVVVSNTFSIPSPPLVATSTVTERFNYDQAGRLKETWHKVKIGTQPETTEILLSQNTYNALGQLTDKKLHSTIAAATDAKQSVDYRYNIRGWLTSINNADLSNIGTNDDTGDLFGMNLAYNDDLGTGNTANAQYNGNINAIKWSIGLVSGTIKQMAYNFTYDPVNRLLSATHKQANTLNTWVLGQYHESVTKYDLNGNIRALQRNGTGGVPIDILAYNYGTTPTNQLQYVDDTAAPNDKAKGFNDGNTSGIDYAYDANGNMTLDKNKSISSAITYNYLNLPEKVTKYGGDNIVYLYDAAGTKRAQIVSQNSVQKTTDYVGPWVFENNTLQFVQHEEGRIVVASEQKLYTNSCTEITSDMVATANTTLATQTINGENYVKATCTASPASSKWGVMFSNIYTVAEGERYLFRVKGYFNGALVSLYAKGNSADLIWPGTSLSRQAPNETWVENTILIPVGITQLTLGVLWSGSATTTDNFLLNEIEFYKLSANAIPEYQYNIKDHLGNVRVTFTSQPQTKTYTAGFETANQTTEANNFSNYPSGSNINGTPGNARTGSNSEHLYPGQVGVSKSFAVMPGDQLLIQAYAKYLNLATTGNSNLAGFATALLGAFNLAAPVAGEASTASTALSAWGGLEANGHADGGNDAIKVFVTIILFDKNYNFLDVSHQAMDISQQAPGASGPQMSASYTVREPGYAYMYISNEHTKPVDIYFDDVTMSMTASQIVQQTDYYPFGLVSQTYSRENVVPNSYQYNGKEMQDELGLGWLDYGARMYDPTTGRWNSIDPLSEHFMSWSPYNYALNNSVTYNDIDGFLPGDPKYSGSGNVVIVIPDGEDDVWDTSTLDGTNWDYGVFKTLHEAANWLNMTYKKDGIQVKNLVVRSHGYVDTGAAKNSGLFIPGDNRELLSPETLSEIPRQSRNVLALANIAGNLAQNGRVLFTACNACMYNDKLGEALFHLMWGESKNLKIFTNGASTSLRSASNKVKVRKTLNSDIGRQYAPWHVTTASGSSNLGMGKSPGLNTNGSLLWFITGSSSTSSGSGSGAKVQSPYHPHKFRGLE